MKKVILEDLTSEALTQLFDDGNEVLLHPKGKSMLPFIREGRDMLKLRRPLELKVGDIVLAWFNGKLLLHRVYALEGEKVTLMGDGNLRGTEGVTTSDVVGVVMEIITPDGHRRKPRKAWLWRHTLALRKYLLKAFRKWHKIFTT